MIPDQEEKRLGAGEGAGAPDGVAVAQRFFLLHELQLLSVRAGGRAVGGGVARMNHDTDFPDAGIEGLLDDDVEGGFDFAVAIHQGLQRQSPLARTRGSDDGLMNFHRFLL